MHALALGHASHERAVGNARAAATELSRRRVERDEVELYLAELAPSGARPAPRRGLTPASARRRAASP